MRHGGCRRADGHVLVPGPAARHRPADPGARALGPIGKAAGFAGDARLTRPCAAYPAPGALPGRAPRRGRAGPTTGPVGGDGPGFSLIRPTAGELAERTGDLARLPCEPARG
jgi:hypothetical protein